MFRAEFPDEEVDDSRDDEIEKCFEYLQDELDSRFRDLNFRRDSTFRKVRIVVDTRRDIFGIQRKNIFE